MSRSRSSPGEPATGSAPDVSSRDPIERIAYLLGPADGPAVFASAGTGWRPPPPGARSTIWGSSPLPSGSPPFAAARRALAREAALGATRLRRKARVHRLPPQRLAGGRVRNAIRAALLGGAVVELPGPGSGPRVFDAAAAAAGASEASGFHLSSSGSILARVRSGEDDAVLRVGVAGAPGDPSRAAAALAHLSPLPLPVPRLLGGGEVAGAAWTLETALPGRRPDDAAPGVLRAVAAFCAGLPEGNGPPGAPRRDLEALATILPDREEAFLALASAIRADLRGLPSITRHGDLWTGNLLVADRRLTGVVDWDAWDPGAVPGADLLHLYATDRRIRERRQLGEVWAARPWKDEAYRSILTGAAASVPGDLLAIAWWASEVRGTVSRHPKRAVEEAWLAVNVDAVLRTLRP